MTHDSSGEHRGCGGGVGGKHRIEPCEEEPFLHALHSCSDCGSAMTSFSCTRHVRVLRYMRIIDFNGTPQVHEVTDACLDPESVWDVEENCCVVEEEDPIESPELVRRAS